MDPEIEPVPKKKVKLDEDATQTVAHESISNLCDFKPELVLSSSSERKCVTLKGTFGDRDDAAIVVLEKQAFDEKDFEGDSAFSSDCVLVEDFRNDIYGNYNFYPKSNYNGIKTTIIYPATNKHIVKYSSSLFHPLSLVNETAELYNTVTLPYLDTAQFTLKWVYNILEHKSEVERIIYEDEDPEIGFVLLPDMKWDGKTLDKLYLQAIVRKHGIRSIRDLTPQHLPLLKNILESGTKTIKDKYDLKSSDLRIYFHYHPSFYHLHVHFTRLSVETGVFAEKAHMLTNVISNIELLPDYYQRVTIPFAVSEGSQLSKKFIEAGILT